MTPDTSSHLPSSSSRNNSDWLALDWSVEDSGQTTPEFRLLLKKWSLPADASRMIRPFFSCASRLVPAGSATGGKWQHTRAVWKRCHPDRSPNQRTIATRKETNCVQPNTARVLAPPFPPIQPQTSSEERMPQHNKDAGWPNVLYLHAAAAGAAHSGLTAMRALQFAPNPPHPHVVQL